MNILILNWRDLGHPEAGGAERYVHEIARRWVAQGHRVTQFCGRARGTASRDERDGVEIIRAGSRFGVYTHAARFLAGSASRFDGIVESVNTRPFFAHRYTDPANAVAIFHQLARDVWPYEVPFPVALAGRYVFEPRWLRAYRGQCVVAASESTESDLREVGISDIQVAHPGTPPPYGTRLPKDPRPTLLYAGRLNASKRPDAAVEAWRLVRRDIPDARLWVIGDGPLRKRLESERADGLTVLGRVDEATKWELMSRASLLLVPSVREGWGIVVMEAASAGTPAVGYRVPGLRDSIVDGRTGWLCDPDPEAMARSVVAALAHPARTRIAEAAAERAAGFSWDDTAQLILDRVAARAPVTT